MVILVARIWFCGEISKGYQEPSCQSPIKMKRWRFTQAWERDETNDMFPDEKVLEAFSNYLSSDVVPMYLSLHQRKKFMHDVKELFWDEPYLYRNCIDGIIRRCVWGRDVKCSRGMSFITCQADHSGVRTVHKMLQYGYYWPTINQGSYEFAKSCDRCHRELGFSRRQEPPMNPIMEI